MSNIYRAIHLVLTHKWYDMIASGEKKEEYRDFTPYWCKRFFSYRQPDGKCVPLDIKEKDLHKYQTEVYNLAKEGKLAATPQAVIFQRAYPKNPPLMKFKIAEVNIGPCGKEEWGAVPGKWYIIIKLGEGL